MEREELLEIIDRAADEQWKELDLAGMELTELPPEIGKLTQLESLILGKFDREKSKSIGNQLTDLPSEIEKLTSLTNLSLSKNQITEIPVVIGKLTSLTNLDLSKNQITKIPSAIGKLVNLNVLDLSKNKITEIPVAISKLINLDELLQLMQKFGICYPIRNLTHTYIAPSLLSKDQPDYTWNETENLIHRNYEWQCN